MTQPQPYQVNNDGYGQAMYAVNECGPGVVVGQPVNEGGTAAHLVDYPGRGAVPVYFENGAPPGSPQWVAQQVMAEQQIMLLMQRASRLLPLAGRKSKRSSCGCD